MKLLASDFDHTLWFDDHMKVEDVQAIQNLQGKGHLFGICTGRGLKGIIHPSQPYHLNYDFYILLSGGLILDKNQSVIFEKTIPISLVRHIYDFIGYQNMSVVSQNQTYVLYKNTHMKNSIYITSLDELQVKEVSSFSYHFEKIEQASEVSKQLKAVFGEKIEAFQNNQHIDLVAKGCSKGKAIELIEAYYKLKHDDVYGIGDSWNDVPMLQAVAHGYTLTYAPKDVRALSEGIVESLADCIKNINDL